LKAVLKEVMIPAAASFCSLMKFTLSLGRCYLQGAMDASNLLKPMLARVNCAVSVLQLWMSIASTLRKMQP
jgi:ATP-dependent Clp protease ATP-binding subunit ClpA